MPSIHLLYYVPLCKNIPILCISLNINGNSAKPLLVLKPNVFFLLVKKRSIATLPLHTSIFMHQVLIFFCYFLSQNIIIAPSRVVVWMGWHVLLCNIFRCRKSMSACVSETIVEMFGLQNWKSSKPNRDKHQGT